jgi:CheY-like chemotaxis protein
VGSAADTSQVTTAGRRRRGLRVLLVEDDAVTQSLLRAQLERGGHVVLAVESAESAIASLEALGCPDVAVVDVDLPGRDGLALLEELHGSLCSRTAGAVVLSATDLNGSDRLDLGLRTCFLAKPVRTDQLLAAIDSMTVDGATTDPETGGSCQHRAP